MEMASNHDDHQPRVDLNKSRSKVDSALDVELSFGVVT